MDPSYKQAPQRTPQQPQMPQIPQAPQVPQRPQVSQMPQMPPKPQMAQVSRQSQIAQQAPQQSQVPQVLQQGQQVPVQQQVPQMPPRPQVPQTPQTPINSGVLSSPQTPLSSGMGDIVLNSGEEEKKPKKGLIIGIIAAVIVIIIMVVVVLLVSGGQGAVEERNAKAAYNRFMNYVLKGEETDADFEYDEIDGIVDEEEIVSINAEDIDGAAEGWSTVKAEIEARVMAEAEAGASNDVIEDGTGPYYNMIKKSDDEDLRATYKAKAEELYNVLANEYEVYDKKKPVEAEEEEENEGEEVIEEEDWKELIKYLKEFYVDYAAFKELDYEDILQSYVNRGREATKTLINTRYAEASENVETDVIEEVSDGEYEVIEEAMPTFGAYVARGKELANWYLGLAEKKIGEGCVVDGAIQDSCYDMTVDEFVASEEHDEKVYDQEGGLEIQGEYVAMGLYDDFYNLYENVVWDEETEEEETE